MAKKKSDKTVLDVLNELRLDKEGNVLRFTVVGDRVKAFYSDNKIVLRGKGKNVMEAIADLPETEQPKADKEEGDEDDGNSNQ